jgi:hypothetical protein
MGSVHPVLTGNRLWVFLAWCGAARKLHVYPGTHAPHMQSFAQLAGHQAAVNKANDTAWMTAAAVDTAGKS